MNWINAERITISGNLPFENVQILPSYDKSHKAPEYFDDSQIIMKSGKDRIITSIFQITAILLSSGKKRLPDNLSKKFTRLTISGEMTFSPVWVLDPGKHQEAGIPLIFREYEQFTFACSEGLYITSDYSITLMEV